MTQENLNKGALELMERQASKEEAQSATELVLDNSNKIKFPGYPYIFEAEGKKIIVSIDIFKSGYECRVCKGKRKIETQCSCEYAEHPGMRYSDNEIATIRHELGSTVADARASLLCPDCKGDYVSQRKTEVCSSCKGIGAVLVLPDSSKNLPTTGVVVSIGNLVKPEKITYAIGSRVLFGPYAGQMIPTKAGLLFKILDWNNVWATIEGANELGQFDFVLQDKEAE